MGLAEARGDVQLWSLQGVSFGRFLLEVDRGIARRHPEVARDIRNAASKWMIRARIWTKIGALDWPGTLKPVASRKPAPIAPILPIRLRTSLRGRFGLSARGDRSSVAPFRSSFWRRVAMLGALFSYELWQKRPKPPAEDCHTFRFVRKIVRAIGPHFEYSMAVSDWSVTESNTVDIPDSYGVTSGHRTTHGGFPSGRPSVRCPCRL